MRRNSLIASLRGDNPSFFLPENRTSVQWSVGSRHRNVRFAYLSAETERATNLVIRRNCTREYAHNAWQLYYIIIIIITFVLRRWSVWFLGTIGDTFHSQLPTRRGFYFCLNHRRWNTERCQYWTSVIQDLCSSYYTRYAYYNLESCWPGTSSHETHFH